MSNADTQSEPLSLQRLLKEPKGKRTYNNGESFMLHVFWEAPSIEAAETILDALERCAAATHRDTPCVPTYFFRMSNLDGDLTQKAPETVGGHPQLKEALKKLQVGVPHRAVCADLQRRGIDPQLLDADPETALPLSMQRKPVMLEFTELYLDQRSFYEHAGSRDYLDAYGGVMKPGLQDRAVTIRLGTPTAEIADNILGPMLKEIVAPMPACCTLWKRPESLHTSGVVIMADISGETDAITSRITSSLQDQSTTLVIFQHPLREERVRLMCVLPNIPGQELLDGLATLPLHGVEMHCSEDEKGSVEKIVNLTALKGVATISTKYSGYLLHKLAGSLELR